MDGGSFSGNSAGQNGGGANVDNTTYITNTQFLNNSANQGGGLLQSTAGQLLSVKAARFEGNHAGSEGGGLWTQGNPDISSTTFQSNSVSGQNDALGGGLWTSGNASISGSRFMTNTISAITAATGAGIYVAGGRAGISDSTFLGNSATYSFLFGAAGGGGIGARGTAQVEVTNSTFESNHASSGAGINAVNARVSGSDFFSNTAGKQRRSYGYRRAPRPRPFADDREHHDRNRRWRRREGGWLGLDQQHVVRRQCRYSARGCYCAGSSHHGRAPRPSRDHRFPIPTGNPAILVTGGSLELMNTIIAGHTVGTKLTGGTLTHDYNLYGPGVSPVSATGGSNIPGSHSLAGDPLFTDPAHRDYHLLPGSPAINGGTGVGIIVDWDGDPRPMFGGYDIGIDEMRFQFQIWLPSLSR